MPWLCLKLGYDAYGSSPRSWTKLYNMNSLKAGDIIRYNGHSIFVTAVSGSTITFGDCNYKGTCQIRWNVTTTKSAISNFSYVLSAPKSLSNVTSQKHIATDFNPTIKDGTYALKNVNSGKMLNVYDGSNSCKDGTALTTWSQDGSADQKFYFKHVSGGKYLVYAVCSGASGSVYKRVVDVNVGSDSVLGLGDSCDVWTQNSNWNDCQLFYVVPVGNDKYVLELASMPNAVLACKNADNAATNGGKITLRNYESLTTQQWYFYNASGSAKVDPSIDASTSTKTYYTGTYKVSATDGLNIRSGAGTSYSKVDAISYNTSITVTQVSGNWGKITYDGVDGWICLDYTTFVSPLVSSISVKTMPTKTSYYVGDTLNTSGLILNVNYSNNTTSTISSGFTCSVSTLSTAGTQTVTVTYSGKTTTFNVTVSAVTLSSISVKSSPTKTSYYVGDTLNTAGLVLNLTYNNGTTSTASSGFTCSPTTLSTAGTQKITVTYSGKTTSFNVNVTAVAVESVTVKTDPTKTSYYVGDTLNTSGLVLNVKYNNGTTSTVSSGFTCSPTTLSTAGTQKITVTYGGKTTSFNVNVSEKTEQTYTVNFYANGGSVTPANTKVVVGNSITLPTPTKTVKVTFNANGGSNAPSVQNCSLNCSGWATSSSATTGEYACGSSYKPTKDITLYAVWQNTAVTINSSVPTRNGYKFLGWSRDASASNASYVAGSKINVSGNVTLYAVWEKYSEGDISGYVIEVEANDMAISYKTVNATIPVSIIYTGDVDYTVEYASSNPSVVTVDDKGNITTIGTGEAEITVTVTDEYGNTVEDTCTVTISYAWWQWIIVIVFFGWIWY